MNDSSQKQHWNLYEVWGDTVDAKHLAWSTIIGLVISLSVFLVSTRIFKGITPSADLARAYAMLAGLGGCVISGVICAVLFKPKRQVTEGAISDTSWRLEVLAKLADQYGDLGSVDDLPADVVAEMKELEIYELFATYKSPAKIKTTTPSLNAELATEKA